MFLLVFKFLLNCHLKIRIYQVQKIELGYLDSFKSSFHREYLRIKNPDIFIQEPDQFVKLS